MELKILVQIGTSGNHTGSMPFFIQNGRHQECLAGDMFLRRRYAAEICIYPRNGKAGVCIRKARGMLLRERLFFRRWKRKQR